MRNITGFVYVARSDEPLADDELYVFENSEDATAFVSARGGSFTEEPIFFAGDPSTQGLLAEVRRTS